jgi:hypothetical protein
MARCKSIIKSPQNQKLHADGALSLATNRVRLQNTAAVLRDLERDKQISVEIRKETQGEFRQPERRVRVRSKSPQGVPLQPREPVSLLGAGKHSIGCLPAVQGRQDNEIGMLPSKW